MWKQTLKGRQDNYRDQRTYDKHGDVNGDVTSSSCCPFFFHNYIGDYDDQRAKEFGSGNWLGHDKETDIPPIPGEFRAMIAASGALGNGKSCSAWAGELYNPGMAQNPIPTTGLRFSMKSDANYAAHSKARALVTRLPVKSP
jgi:hypothetical protein